MTNHLGAFDDRWTMRYERVYPHPIERVWEAVTVVEHLETWLFPACGVTVEARLGGHCSFAWGAPPPQSMAGTVAEFDPPRRITYQLADSFLRFDLSAVEGGTHLCFIHGFSPGAPQPIAPPGAGSDWDYPAGPGTPWRPGFTAGFHLMLDQLGDSLDGIWTYADARPYLEALRRDDGSAAEIAGGLPERRRPHGRDWAELVEVYRVHLAATCPAAGDDHTPG